LAQEDVWYSAWFWAVILTTVCLATVVAKGIEMACFGVVNAHLVRTRSKSLPPATRCLACDLLPSRTISPRANVP
jgi:hypothetical protein